MIAFLSRRFIARRARSAAGVAVFGLAALVSALALTATATAEITGPTALTDVTPATPPFGLPRTYTAIPVDTPNPIPDGFFGWGIASADLTGSGHADLLVAQSNTGPGQVFEFDGVTGGLLRTINPPETNPDGSAPTFAYVYVATIPSIGSCPGGQVDQICPNPTIGPPNGIPDIVAGSRNLQVPATDDANGQDTLNPTATSPHIGRLYIFDGLTGAILKRIDMPAADRTLEASVNASPQFGRIGLAPQGMAPCAGLNSENNAVGVGPCPSTPLAVRIGSVDGSPYPSIVTTARSFLEKGGPASAGGTSPAGTACANASGTTNSSGVTTFPNCTAGRVYVYSGAAIAGSNPQAIDDTPMYTIKDPDAQTANTEFGGNIFPIGDVTGGNVPGQVTNGTAPDGIPDFVIATRNAGYPLLNPDPAYPAVGVGFVASGATGNIAATIPDPQPQPKVQFTGTFNMIRPVGQLLGPGTIPDFILPAAAQNMFSTADGAAFVFNGDQNAGGGGEGSWHFATLTDPNPHIGGDFGGSYTGIGDLVPHLIGNDVMVGSYSPFDPSTATSNDNINSLFIFNAQSQTLLQTIPDPDQSPGSGFGVGITPMGDLNNSGLESYAASSFLWNGSVAGQGRAYILMANNSPAPKPPPNYKKGACANVILGTKGHQNLIAPSVASSYGFKIFGGHGNDTIEGGHGVDCLHGGQGDDVIIAGSGKTTIIGGTGEDVIRGGRGADKLYGGHGDDRIYAGSGNTLLVGAKHFHDLLVGGSGKDRFYGNGGDNVIIVGRGESYINTGSGRNWIDANNGKGNVVVCGRGENIVVADHKDRLINCQVVFYTLRPQGPLKKSVLKALRTLRQELAAIHPTVPRNG